MPRPLDPLAFQPPNGLMPGPRAGRRARTTIRVGHAGLDAVEELLDLLLVLAEDAGGQAVLGSIRELQRLIEREHRRNGDDGNEALLGKDGMV